MIEGLRALDSLLWMMLVVIDLKMRMSLANSVCSARIANSFCGCSRAARDFLGMSCVLERIVPHPKGFICLSTGNSVDFPPQPLGRRKSSCSWFVQISWAKKKKNKLTKILCHKKLLNLSRAI